MATPSQNPLWVLKKAVLVYAPDVDVSCFARLRIAHDKTANQGSVSLGITADLANLTSRSNVLTLNVSPDRVDECALARISNDDLCSAGLVSMLRAPVPNVSAVSTLTLRLNATGVVLCPFELKSICPIGQGDLNFHAFAKICQSKFLRVHFSRRQFVKKELDQLENFSRALRERGLDAESFDHARHGVVQRDWRAFGLSLDPPPYCEEPSEHPPLYGEETGSEQVVGKRRRDPWSLPSSDEGRKRLLLSPQPIGSPTEVNTPSTQSPSPSTSIRPTYFTRAPSPGRAERNKLARLELELRGVSDELVRELLIRTGHQHLLAIPKPVDKDVDRDLASEPDKASSTEVDILERRLKRYVDETIERRLKSHLVDGIVDSAVSDCRDHFFDECKAHEAEFRDQIDDGNCEVRITTAECLNEMKEQAQKHMREIEEHAHLYMTGLEEHGIEAEMAAKEKVAELKRCFTSAQSLLSPNHELGTNVRRSSF